jgi:hypothetical protein
MSRARPSAMEVSPGPGAGRRTGTTRRRLQLLDAVVERDDARDLGADGRAALAADEVGALRIDRRRQLAQDAPLGPASPTARGSSG